MDLLAVKYLSISNYSYVANTSTNAIDPDGKQIIFRLFYNEDKNSSVDLTYKNASFYFQNGLKYDPSKGW